MSKLARQMWLLLIHQLPPKPDYVRVKIRRRLLKIGAVAVKNTVYVLPKHEETLEDFHWILEEIHRDGGEGMICEADLIEGLSDKEVIGLFKRDRDAAYAEITEQSRALLNRVRLRALTADMTRQCEAELARLRRSFEEVAELDFFAARGRESTLGVLQKVEERMKTRGQGTRTKDGEAESRKAFTGRIWVTRANIFVDRMASVWLIKRFIDGRARFKFVDAEDYRPREREVRFDTFEGEFTHRGDKCTFEVLLENFKLREPALSALAEMVHDIDMKDSRFGREEIPGVALALRAIRSQCTTDEQRLEKGISFFDALYEELRRSAGKKLHG